MQYTRSDTSDDLQATVTRSVDSLRILERSTPVLAMQGCLQHPDFWCGL